MRIILPTIPEININLCGIVGRKWHKHVEDIARFTWTFRWDVPIRDRGKLKDSTKRNGKEFIECPSGWCLYELAFICWTNSSSRKGGWKEVFNYARIRSEIHRKAIRGTAIEIWNPQAGGMVLVFTRYLKKAVYRTSESFFKIRYWECNRTGI